MAQENLVASLAAGCPSRRLLERRLAQIGLGIVSALSQGQMTVEQAGREFFNLRNFERIRRLRLSKAMTEFFDWGMELDDVAQLAPEGLEESYEHMRRLAWRMMRRSVPPMTWVVPTGRRVRRSA
jgi:hypothetical protein